jgi:hypothetical protein
MERILFCNGEQVEDFQDLLVWKQRHLHQLVVMEHPDYLEE